MQRKIIPDIVKKQSISALKPDNTVYEAATMMAKVNVGAIVIENGKGLLTGIVTERDLTRRVVAKGLDPKKTPIADIMSANPDSLAPDDSAGDALELMLSRHFRHLPVVEDGKCVGMVSIRDLYMAVKSSLEENIQETEAFVFGDRYGA
ncbi:MAG: CBS domain-containing protein [Rhodospirillaceae bacterium]|jgi:CBS domain-containing protein|nr:CBS domain-containing protein [Rhodospirillaceae bacterium]|tara:strand:+ start:1799 stop:2245 length:447 start_codon:yes stop_codon:yes gene_type:complete